jgi:glycosyltransferase involved in cell wall biosynthesis
MTTYNHEPFIAQAIESVLAQETSFCAEVVIGEDLSTDRTREIARAYRERYPNKIRLLLQERNLGARANFVRTYKACRGDYIALLQGDDYWTSPHKLQRQVEFLDAHQKCTLCFHSVAQCCQTEGSTPTSPSRKTRNRHLLYAMEDLLEGNFIATCSVMYRNGVVSDFPSWFFETPMGDWPAHVLHAQHGEIGYIDEVMATYRIHGGGIWSPMRASERRKGLIDTLKTFRENLDPKYGRKLEQSIARWHFKVINALKLEKDYRGIAPYAWNLVLHSDVSRGALITAAFWAATSRFRR